MNNRRFGLIVVLVAGLLGACGGGDSSEDGEDFVSQADEICITAAQERKVAADEQGTDSSLAAGMTRVEGEVAVTETELDDLAALEVPADVEEQFQEYLGLREDSLASLRDAAAASSGSSFTKAIDQGLATHDEADEVGADIGFQACASELPPEDEQAVEQLITDVLEASDPERICGELLTEYYIALTFDGPENCEKETVPYEVEITDIGGVAGVVGTAKITVPVGGEPQDFEAGVFYEDGRWKLDSIN